MATEADRSMDIERAKNLKREIEVELASVASVLSKVADECNANPAEEDTILKTIDELGKELQSSWKDLATGFEDAMDKLGNIISSFFNFVEEKVDEVNEFKSKKNF